MIIEKCLQLPARVQSYTSLNTIFLNSRSSIKLKIYPCCPKLLCQQCHVLTPLKKFNKTISNPSFQNQLSNSIADKTRGTQCRERQTRSSFFSIPLFCVY